MNDSTTTEYFKLIKQHMELHLPLNGWRWSAQDSLLLDWAIQNMEATRG
jgi:hypothetical protein